MKPLLIRWLNRNHRRTKTFLLKHRPPIVKAENHSFRTEDMVRGNGLTLKDWSPDDKNGIHLVLQKAQGPGGGRS